MNLKPIPNRIFVGGLKEFIKQEDLFNYFSSFGSVKDVKIIQDHSNVPKGNYGFVTFFEPGVVERILACDTENLKIKDKKININYAVKRSNDTPEVRLEDPLKPLAKENIQFEENTAPNHVVNDCCRNKFCYNCLRDIRSIHENIDFLKKQVNNLIEMIKGNNSLSAQSKPKTIDPSKNSLSTPRVEMSRSDFTILNDKMGTSRIDQGGNSNWPRNSMMSVSSVWNNETWLQKNKALFGEKACSDLKKSFDCLEMEIASGKEGERIIENSRINEKYQREILSLRNDSELFQGYESLISAEPNPKVRQFASGDTVKK